MTKIDKLDREILNHVIANARIPFTDIAELCGVSRAAVHQRVGRLTEGGVIRGSGYHVDYRLLGYTTNAYIGIKLERGSLYKEVTEKLLETPEIVECHYTTGAYSVLIRLLARDNQHLMEILSEVIQMIPGVVSTETMLTLSECFSRPFVLPLEDQEGKDKEF